MSIPLEPNAIYRAAKLLGGFEATGRLCNVSGKAVMKWAANGRLPRTEWTGETHYAETMMAALSDRDPNHGILFHDLRPLPKARVPENGSAA